MQRTGSLRTLREETLENYISSSVGPHRHLREADFLAFQRAYLYHLRGWLPLTQGQKWLDLGCGQGALMRLALSYGYEKVYGIDVSEEMLVACQSYGLNVECADVWHWLAGTADKQWNIVSAFDLLEHFPKEEGYRLLREIWRILAPYGVCLVKLPNAASPWGLGVTAADLTHEACYSPESLSQLAKLAGFSSCELREVGPFPGSTKAKLRHWLWAGVRRFYQALNVIETGSAGSRIYTRVMLGRLIK
ncbi:MAG: class I SAM-dependent methyltransferase [Acidobacteriota bacterium]